MNSLHTSLLALAVSAGTASAQTYTELIREGDALPGSPGEFVTRIDNVDVNGNGDWLIELDTDGPTTGDAVVLHNGNVLWREGTSMGFTAPAGKEASSFVDTLDINDNGDVMFITPVRDAGTTSTNGYLLIWNGITLVEAGTTPCGAAGLPAGSIYDHVSEAWQNNNRQLLVGVRIDDGTATNNAMMRIDIDAAGNLVSETILAMEGQTLPGPNHVTPIQGFSFSKGRQAINDNGECMWYVDDEHSIAPGSTLSDSNMYMTDAMNVNTLLYNEADTFPTDPSQVFDHFSTAEVDLNNNGDFVFSGFDRGPSTGDSWIFKSIGGTIQVLAHEGQLVPASVPGMWQVAGFGFGGVVPMSNDGEVLWYLDWDDPDTTKDTGLLLDDQLLLQEGVSMLGGLVVDDVPNSDTEVAMSDSGKYAIIEIILEDPAMDLDAVYLIDLKPTLGTAYCGPAVANSTGSPGTLVAVGSDVLADDDFTLIAESLALNAFAFGLVSDTQGFMANPGGSAGNLCLDGAIGRGVGGVIGNTGATGTFTIPVDLSMLPHPVSGTVATMVGDTWNFQVWYRDAVGGSATSNFTDAVSVTFN